MTQKFDIFISYATVDLEVVAPFVKLLQRDGFKVWFDIEQMRGGLPAMGQMADGIAQSTHTIACLSDAYFDRQFTMFELQNSMYLNPAGNAARTIPVKFRPLTREVPNYLGWLTICDLTDQRTFDQTYGLITSQIQRIAEQAGSASDPPATQASTVDEVGRACDAAFTHLDDPNIALFQVRRAVEALAKVLYRQCIGDLPANASLDLLIEGLVVSGKLPQDVNAALAVVQTYGRYVVRDQMDGFLITRESVAPALNALRVLTEHVLPERKSADLWSKVWQSLPAGAHLEERQIPDTPYLLRQPQLSRNSLGPLYAGRHATRNEPVSVNLVTLPKQNDDAFFEEVARFTRLGDANIVSPLDAGRVVVDGRRLCLYLIMPSVDGVSAQDLVEHFGTLPPRAAFELCIGIAQALTGFHEAYPPIVHGDIKPANVLIGAFGTVRVLCVGRQITRTLADAGSGDADGRIDSFFFSSPEQRTGAPVTPKTDLFALSGVLMYLLTGVYPTHDEGETVAAQGPEGAAEVYESLARCQTAAAATQVLERACRSLPDSDNLKQVNQRFRQKSPRLGLWRPEPSGGSAQIHLVNSCRVDARDAWPLGAGQVLVWEMGTNTLAAVQGTELVWRDTQPVLVRRVALGTGDQVAVGGWDGFVRFFAGGNLAASTKLDGAIGDLQFTAGGLVIGTWKRALWHISAHGEHRELLGIDKGVHRIAVADRADRFAVADLSGGLTIYASGRKVADIPAFDSITDLAYAGTRLVILADGTLTGIRLDGTRGATESKPGALRLLPSSVDGSCLLLVEAAGDGGAPVQEAWLVDEADRQVRHLVLKAGDKLLSASRMTKRLTVSTSDGGCSYWRDGTRIQHWPDALSAVISACGTLIAVTRPGTVDLYEDPA